MLAVEWGPIFDRRPPAAGVGPGGDSPGAQRVASSRRSPAQAGGPGRAPACPIGPGPSRLLLRGRIRGGVNSILLAFGLG
jgi:hypothetical protein